MYVIFQALESGSQTSNHYFSNGKCQEQWQGLAKRPLLRGRKWQSRCHGAKAGEANFEAFSKGDNNGILTPLKMWILEIPRGLENWTGNLKPRRIPQKLWILLGKLGMVHWVWNATKYMPMACDITQAPYF